MIAFAYHRNTYSCLNIRSASPATQQPIFRNGEWQRNQRVPESPSNNWNFFTWLVHLLVQLSHPGILGHYEGQWGRTLFVVRWRIGLKTFNAFVEILISSQILDPRICICYNASILYENTFDLHILRQIEIEITIILVPNDINSILQCQHSRLELLIRGLLKMVHVWKYERFNGLIC